MSAVINKIYIKQSKNAIADKNKLHSGNIYLHDYIKFKQFYECLCFYKYMVEQVDNSVNKQINYTQNRTPVGVLPVPGHLPKKVIYSAAEAKKQYYEMQHDIYVKEQSAHPKEKHKFPKVMKILLGTTGLASIILFRKSLSKMLRKIIKNPFK